MKFFWPHVENNKIIREKKIESTQSPFNEVFLNVDHSKSLMIHF